MGRADAQFCAFFTVSLIHLVLLVNSCFCYEHGVWQRWAVKPASATKYAGTTNGARNFPNFPIFLVKPKFMFN